MNDDVNDVLLFLLGVVFFRKMLGKYLLDVLHA